MNSLKIGFDFPGFAVLIMAGRMVCNNSIPSFLPLYGMLLFHWIRPDNYFGCQQFEVNETVYLVILYNLVHPLYGRCCVFKRGWHVFTPSFLESMRYSHRSPLNGQLADWYELKWQDVPPFVWGFYVDRLVKYSFSPLFSNFLGVPYSSFSRAPLSSLHSFILFHPCNVNLLKSLEICNICNIVGCINGAPDWSVWFCWCLQLFPQIDLH